MNAKRLGVPLIALALVAGGIAAAVAFSGKDSHPVTLPAGDTMEPGGGQTNWPVHIRQPEHPPRVATGLKNFAGEPVSISCSSCHSTATPNVQVREAGELVLFHQGMRYQHGNLSCLSCHNAGDYDALRLADGTSLRFQDVMQLCAQCHGPQARDFQHGAHGGMTGYWDLSRGPRHRNSCIDCHDPHAPKYPAVMPVFPPAESELKSRAAGGNKR